MTSLRREQAATVKTERFSHIARKLKARWDVAVRLRPGSIRGNFGGGANFSELHANNAVICMDTRSQQMPAANVCIMSECGG
jgi:hypothetical protein